MVICAMIGRRNHREIPNSVDGKMGIPKSLSCWSRSVKNSRHSGDGCSGGYIYISAYVDGKMRYLRAYSEDAKKNIRKFIPYYEDFDAQTYFGVFGREFFRVIKKLESSLNAPIFKSPISFYQSPHKWYR
jgi:hypothetical protein